MKTLEEVVKRLKSHANPKNVEGMARFGISSKNTLGVSVPILRKMGKEIGKNHELALKLWDTGIHEARLLAGFIDIPQEVTEKQMEKWVSDFDSWDICDQVCMNLFDKTPFTRMKIVKWSDDKREFVKRAAFALMACLSVHDKKADDAVFIKFFHLIKKEAYDDRNFVKKSVNWALRQIGKRNDNLIKHAIACAKELEKTDSKSAKWIAKDALREFAKHGPV